MDPRSVELVRVPAILHANAPDQQIDDDMALVLLQLYANEQQTVVLFLL